ncbi:MAG TPA: multiubiquitin domain-containing protein [Stellaceae bacterium]|nr:multiubiquitin domain-containing protein [Stellaceae bacterium]
MTQETEGKSEKVVTIIVDGAPHKVEKEKITYAEVVTFADPDYSKNPQVTYSVTYSKGPHDKPQGTLSPGGSVMVKEGMIFRVSRTGQS